MIKTSVYTTPGTTLCRRPPWAGYSVSTALSVQLDCGAHLVIRSFTAVAGCRVWLAAGGVQVERCLATTELPAVGVGLREN
jgi:hypothetical protein